MSSEVETYYEANNEKVRACGSWITDEFLQDLISRQENDENARIVKREVKAAVGLGDNFLSIMYQMNVEFISGKTGAKEQRRFLIKGLPTAKILLSMIEEFDLFRKELYVYNVCLSEMRKLAEEYLPGDDGFIAPELYKCDFPDVLVLEDLKLSGYKMAHRREQLDFAHTAVTLRSLARFHALSVKLLQRKPEISEILSRKEIYSRAKIPKMYFHVVGALKSWYKVMKEEESTARFVPLIEKATKNIMNKMVYVVNDKEGSFSCINHGDSRTNNFMYRYDKDGNVVHAKLVDFQLARHASPILDLLYFFFSSSKPEVLMEKFDELIRIYHEALVSDLERLRIDASTFPTLEDIRNEMKKRSVFGVISVVTVTAITTAKPSDTADFENFDLEGLENSDNNILEKNFRDSHYRDLVAKYMTICEKTGYLKSAEELVVNSD